MDVSLLVRRLAIAVPLALLVSCIDDVEQLGVSLLHDFPAVVWAPCSTDDPPVVELLLTENDNGPGGGDDQVLWRAVPSEPTNEPWVTPFGVEPEGYQTTIPLEEELDPFTTYTLYMHPGGGGVIVFRPRDLQPGRIASQGGRLRPERFLEYAREGCGYDELVDGAEPIVMQLG